MTTARACRYLIPVGAAALALTACATGSADPATTAAATGTPGASVAVTGEPGSPAPMSSDPAMIAPSEGMLPYGTEAEVKSDLSNAASMLAFGIASGSIDPWTRAWGPLTDPIATANGELATTYVYGGWDSDAGTYCLDAASLEEGAGSWWHYSDESGQVVPGPCPDNKAPFAA